MASDPPPRRAGRTGTLRGVGLSGVKPTSALKPPPQSTRHKEPTPAPSPVPRRLALESTIDEATTTVQARALNVDGDRTTAERARAEARAWADSIADGEGDRPSLEGGRHREVLPGMILAGKFALVRMIAEGPTTQVFEAEDSLVGRRVALKVLLPEPAQHADIVRRFRQEASATAMVAHPNVVTVHEVGRRSDGALYIVQELLTGKNLLEVRQLRGRLSLVEAVSVLAPIAGALAFAHSQGVVHRDVKPSNIVLSAMGYGAVVPKLIDFGVARVETPRGRGRTMAGTLLGTAHYMSPEQAMAASFIDGRADVWALSVVLYELLSGVRPFDGPNDHAVLARVLSDTPARIETLVPTVSRDLADLLHKGLERDVRERPGIEQLQAALQRLCNPSSLSVLLTDPADPVRIEEMVEAVGLLPGDVAALSAAPPDVEELAIDVPVVVEADDDSEPLDDEDIEVVTESESPEPVVSGVVDWPRSTAQIQMDSGFLPSTGEKPDRFAEAAQRALRVNALEESVLHAEMSISAGHSSGEPFGQMRLVQAIALYWLGSYEECLEKADSSISALDVMSTAWLGATGYKVMALGKLGLSNELAELRRYLGENDERLGAAHVIALCRLAVTMTTAGDLIQARQLVRSLRDRMDRQAASESVVFAWLDRAFAERAEFVGDPARELSRRKSALERFTSAGDVRNACQERAQLGGVYLRTGVFDEAEKALSESLQMAEPMQLHVVGVIQAYLGLLALRRRDIEGAERRLTEALAWGVERGDRRVEAIARTHLATVMEQTRGHEPALVQIAAAKEAAFRLPAHLAHAFGAEAAILLRVGEKDGAIECATLAARTLDEHGGAGDAESLIRLTHALALSATGDIDEGRQRIRDARSRIVGLADRIPDPRHKRCFLELPENRRILRLAREWVDGQRSTHESVG